MYKFQLTVLSVIFVLLAVSPSFAKDFNSSLEDARTAYQAGDNLTAFKSLRQSIFSVWDNIPLTVLDAELVTDQSSYTPKDSNVYSSGDNIYIVCQVVGYNIKKKHSLNNINIASDFRVLDKEENVLMEKNDFATFDIATPFPNTEFKMDFNYTLNAPPGKYILQTELRDQNSDKATEFNKTIVIE